MRSYFTGMEGEMKSQSRYRYICSTNACSILHKLRERYLVEQAVFWLRGGTNLCRNRRREKDLFLLLGRVEIHAK
jgi:hypothetical protein